MPAVDPSGKTERKKTQPETAVEPVQGHWLERLGAWWLRFDRFGWDIFGVILLVLALITLLGLLGFTSGLFVSPWASFLQKWMGWGSYAVAAFMGFIGVLALRRQSSERWSNYLSRILVLEGWVFILLMLLSVANGHDLTRAENGLDGGLVGWSLAQLFSSFLPSPWLAILLVLLLLIFTLWGFGFDKLLARAFEKWLYAPQAEDSTDALEPLEAESPTGEEEESTETRLAIPLPRDPRLPPLELLKEESKTGPDEQHVHETAARLETALAEFGVPARVVGFRVGPTVTQYAVEPGFLEKPGQNGEPAYQKVRVSQISSLTKDLALALSAERLRIEAPVPGHSFVGIEVPNPQSSMVRIRSILESEQFRKINKPLAIALGRDVSGRPVVADLARMPHLLIAGTTGSGKSVCIEALTLCLAMNNLPQDLKLVMLDPKMVELVRFNGLPHLLGKVETETQRMLAVLVWALSEMDRRYRLLEAARTRDIETYNQKMLRRKQETLPRIVILLDELADLMMTAPDQTEHSIVRLAQMARATGMHLVVATQRPSTDIVTGLIKANFPARISFTVASSIDSRVILDTNGAESLLGRGDLLFLNPESGSPLRAQGALITDEEVDAVIHFWQNAPAGDQTPSPWEELVQNDEESDSDRLVDEAIKIVQQTQRASASLLQRRLRIGYPRAARLIDELEELGVVGPNQGGGREREVLLSKEDTSDEESELDQDGE